MSQVALVVKNSPANVGDIKRCGFDPWVGKNPWRRAWQPTPVFLPRESHGQRSLVGYGPWGHKESDTTEVTYHIQSCYIFLQRVLNCPDCGYTVTAFTQTKTQSCDKEIQPNANCMWSSRHPQPDCMLQPPHFWILCYSRLCYSREPTLQGRCFSPPEQQSPPNDLLGWITARETERFPPEQPAVKPCWADPLICHQIQGMCWAKVKERKFLKVIKTFEHINHLTGRFLNVIFSNKML